MPAATLEAATTHPGFIQATEVWIPDPSGEVLIRSDGIYGPLKAFDRASADHGFAKGEGLPGLAWKEQRPVILTDIADPRFLRSGAAREAGLGAAAAIPVFSRDRLKGVLVMICGRDDDHVGAVEVWSSDNSPESKMTLDAGFYGAATAFREVSEGTTFERGKGLPGGVWGAGAPILMRDLGRSAGFVRSASAREAGLTTGLGVPVPTPGGMSYVLTLLTSRTTPIARRFEIWEVVAGKGGARPTAALIDGLCDTEGPLWETERRIQAWQGPVGRALATGTPVAEANPAAAPGAPRHAGMVALPQHVHGEVARIAAWYF